MSISITLSDYYLGIPALQRVEEMPKTGSGRSPTHNFWVDEPKKILMPLAYAAGMVGYTLSILPRIACVFKDACMVLLTFFYALSRRLDDDSIAALKIRIFALGASCAEVGSAFIGVVCPIIAYKIDDYLQTYYWINTLSFFPYGDANEYYYQNAHAPDPIPVPVQNSGINNHSAPQTRVLDLDPDDFPDDPELQRDIRANMRMGGGPQFGGAVYPINDEVHDHFDPRRQVNVLNVGNDYPAHPPRNLLFNQGFLMAVLIAQAQLGGQDNAFNAAIQLSNEEHTHAIQNETDNIVQELPAQEAKGAFNDLENYVDHAFCGEHMSLITQFTLIRLFDKKIGSQFVQEELTQRYAECKAIYDKMLAALPSSQTSLLKDYLYHAALQHYFKAIETSGVKSEMDMKPKSEAIDELKDQVAALDQKLQEEGDVDSFIKAIKAFHGSFYEFRVLHQDFYKQACS